MGLVHLKPLFRRIQCPIPSANCLPAHRSRRPVGIGLPFFHKPVKAFSLSAPLGQIHKIVVTVSTWKSVVPINCVYLLKI